LRVARAGTAARWRPATWGRPLGHRLAALRRGIARLAAPLPSRPTEPTIAVLLLAAALAGCDRPTSAPAVSATPAAASTARPPAATSAAVSAAAPAASAVPPAASAAPPAPPPAAAAPPSPAPSTPALSPVAPAVPGGPAPTPAEAAPPTGPLAEGAAPQPPGTAEPGAPPAAELLAAPSPTPEGPVLAPLPPLAGDTAVEQIVEHAPLPPEARLLARTMRPTLTAEYDDGYWYVSAGTLGRWRANETTWQVEPADGVAELWELQSRLDLR